jgi:hypothetical protein
VFTLQSCVRTEFTQSALQAVDLPCRITSQISYTHLREDVSGTEPFSNLGRSTEWPESRLSPLFRGVRAHLNKRDMSLLVLFNSKADPSIRKLRHTLAPIAYEHQARLLVSKGLSETHANFEIDCSTTWTGRDSMNLKMSAHFLNNDSADMPQEIWEKEKGRVTIGADKLLRCRTPEPSRSILHPDLRIPAWGK